MQIYIPFLFGFFFLLTSCQAQEEPTYPIHPGFPYQLDNPVQTLSLPAQMKEISGLSLSMDGQFFVAVQDEDGKVFFLDKGTGQIAYHLPFWKDGDYEGIEVLPSGEVFVAKSTGTLYGFFPEEGYDPSKTVKYKGFLTQENDIEGLCYDPVHNRLLLACKNKVDPDSKDRLKRLIASFDLKTRTFVKEPYFIITLEMILEYFEKQVKNAEELKGYKKFCDKKCTNLPIAPSGIAIHPITGDIYILSSKSKWLLVLTPEKTIKYVEKIPKKRHLQPEAICFDKDGSLFIANEGDDLTPGRIYRFNPVQTSRE